MDSEAVKIIKDIWSHLVNIFEERGIKGVIPIVVLFILILTFISPSYIFINFYKIEIFLEFNLTFENMLSIIILDALNTTVLFDLVTSLTGADGNTYTRQEKDSTSTATAWVYNDTLYYTSGVSDNANGVNEPSVSDAIYSDAACQNSITTITAIA